MINPGRSFRRFYKRCNPPKRAALLTAAIALMFSLHGGTVEAQEPHDLSSLSVDDLMNVEVTSVSRRAQKLSDTPAAVFVITAEDIRRSGATSIPEILRMAPGLDVARINGSVWAISARGSNGQFANKLLVMIDGRTVYSPLFSGVYWDVQDTVIEDIDHIEVIRGPGGTLWGANAVNGIINIITKHAVDTRGALLSIGGGAREGVSAAGRYGGSFGRNGNYRIFGKSFDRPASIQSPMSTHDAWALGRAGFRADWTSHRGDTFTAQGDSYRGTEAAVSTFDPSAPFADRAVLNRVSGTDLQLRWAATQSSRSDTTLQAFYDTTRRSHRTLEISRRTFDVDFQNHIKIGRWNDVIWGTGYRRSVDTFSGIGLALNRDSNVQNLASAFVQDEIHAGTRIHIAVGTKFQYEPLSHVQFQPTLRLLFNASESQTIWAAATRAIRTPSEMERYVTMTVGAFPDGHGNTGLIVLSGNDKLRSERVQSYELGYRWHSAYGVTFDATAFHSRLNDFIGTDTKPPFVDSSRTVIVPIVIENGVNGHANGAEFLLSHFVAPSWNVALGYTLFQQSAVDNDGLRSSSEIGSPTPRHQLQLRSFIHLPRQLELDSSAFYVGRVGSSVPAYLRVDAQLSWRPTDRWNVSVSGQNLLQAQHSEFVGINGESDLTTPIQRTVNGKITWHF